MKSYTKILSAAFAVAMLVGTASANLITGTIGFNGVATLDNADLSAATKVTAISAVVGTHNGSFAPVATLTPVSFNLPWSFASVGVVGLWSVGGFTFDLTSSAVVSQTGTFLNVQGTGWLSGNGYEATRGVWSFTIPGAGDNLDFTFASSTTAVPDGGMTALLLGAGLLSLGFAARRKNA